MLYAKKVLKLELQRIWDLNKDQEKTIKNDEMAKFLENDSIKLALKEKGVRAKIRVHKTGAKIV
jgi:hypothetical protein